MNKTADIEFAIAVVLRDDPITLDDLEERLYGRFPALQGEDRRWIGVALMHLKQAGKIRYPGCGHDSHEGGCKVEAVR